MKRLLATSAALLALGACTAKDRTFPGASGGMGGGDASASTTGGPGGGGTSGGGTSGGVTSSGGTGTAGGGKIACTATGLPFDVLSSTDLAGDALDNNLFLVPEREGGVALVHVAIQNEKHSKLYVKSIVNKAAPGGNLFTYVPAPGVHFDLSGASMPLSGGSLHVYGTYSDSSVDPANYGLARMSIPVLASAGGVQQVTEELAPLGPTRACGSDGTVGTSAVFPVAGGERFLMTCSNPDNQYNLYAGSSVDGTSVAVVTHGASTDLSMHPTIYAYVNGTHFAYFNAGTGDGAIAFGTKDTDVTTLHPFSLNGENGSLTSLFGFVPTPDDHGLVFLAGAIAANQTNTQVWEGSVPADQFTSLTKTPPTSLEVVKSLDKLSEFAPLYHPAFDENHIAGAGVALDSNTVNFSLFDRTGTPLAIEQQIHQDASVNVSVAGAAPFDQFKHLVVWVENDSSNPPIFKVRATLVLCQQE